MSTATATLAPRDIRLSAGGVLRSEWIKMRTLRSTVWAYAIVILVSLGLAALMSAVLDPGPGGQIPADQQAGIVLQASTFGVFFGQLVVATLGVLVISGEYSTGMIRSTLTAVPKRLGALWAKAAVLFVATFLVGAVSTIAAYFVASPILATQGVSASLIGDGLLMPLLGGALYLALVAVLALGVGTILRSSAGGIAAVLGILLILPLVLSMIPTEWAAAAVPYLFSSAGNGLFALQPDISYLTITLAWVAASLGGASLLLVRRDA